MSLEQKIEELTGTITALIAVQQQVVANQERLLAGQKDAIEAVKAGNPATATTRGRKAKAADTPNTSDAPADTASGADDANSASDEAPTPPSEEKSTPVPAEKMTFGVAAKKWMDKAEKGTDEYKSRGQKVMAILGNFGAGKISELDAEHEDKAMFFLKRSVKGLPVTFDAAYDFAGPVDQAEPVAEAAAVDDDEDMFA